MRLALLMGLLVAAEGCQTTQVVNGIPNLAEVEPGIWRGGQPSPEGWAWLKSQGITRVVKLNPFREASDDGSGMAVTYSFPVSIEEQINPLEGKRVLGLCSAAALEVVPDTFVHCSHGQDRTGLVIGLYRLRQGWTKGAAWDEMRAHGFHPELLGLWNAWLEAR